MTSGETLPISAPDFGQMARDIFLRLTPPPTTSFEKIFADAEQTSRMFNGARAILNALAETLATVVGPAENYRLFHHEVNSFFGASAMAIAIGPSPDKPIIDTLVTSHGIQGAEGLGMGKYYGFLEGHIEKPYGYQESDFNYHSLLRTTQKFKERTATRTDRGVFVDEATRGLDEWRDKHFGDRIDHGQKVWPVYALANRLEGYITLGALDFNTATLDFETFLADLYVKKVLPLVVGSKQAEFSAMFQKHVMAISRPDGDYSRPALLEPTRS